jgi:hypothetical protein
MVRDRCGLVSFWCRSVDGFCGIGAESRGLCTGNSECFSVVRIVKTRRYRLVGRRVGLQRAMRGRSRVGKCRNLWGGELCPGAEAPRKDCVAFGAYGAWSWGRAVLAGAQGGVRVRETARARIAGPGLRGVWGVWGVGLGSGGRMLGGVGVGGSLLGECLGPRGVCGVCGRRRGRNKEGRMHPGGVARGP